MTATDILYDVSDGVATITFNRPDNLNALTGAMTMGLRTLLKQASTDDTVRAIVLTGAGRGFCAGADMGNLQTLQQNEQAQSQNAQEPEPFDLTARPDFLKPFSYPLAVPKPVIAAINGPCAGLGFVITLFCDLRFASETAVFTTAFSRRGLIAEHGASWMLPRLVGMANACDLLYSARRVAAEEAQTMGLVNRVFPHDELMAATYDYARILSREVSPRSLQVMKRQLWDAQFQSLAEAIDTANADMALSLKSEDFKEGVAHFVERRPPAFTGK